jgi:hypothetical protein
MNIVKIVLDPFVVDKVPAASLSLTPSFPSSNLSPPLPSSAMSPPAAMQAAIVAGNSAALSRLLASNRTIVNEPITGDVTLLHCAVERGNEGRLKLISCDRLSA